jgi:hypothetical protein
MRKKRSRGNPVPLIVENHPQDYAGYPFITLIQYRKQHVLALVDNVDAKSIRSYILDLCGPAKVDEERVIEVATHWWHANKDKYPISFEFSRLGLTPEVSVIYRTYNIEYVTRVIGPLPKFEMAEVHQVKRRKRKPVPPGMDVTRRVRTLK